MPLRNATIRRSHALVQIAQRLTGSAIPVLDRAPAVLTLGYEPLKPAFESIADILDEEWDKTFTTNISALFYLTKAAVPHMKSGSAIINTALINADSPSPLLAYATTKGAIQNFTGGLAQMLAEKGERGGARPRMDAAHPLHAAGESRSFRGAGAP